MKYKTSISFFFLCFLEPEKARGFDLEVGEKLFLLNCNICHLGGENFIIPEKSLKKENLEGNGMNSVKALAYQIKNGKNGMPGFGDRLQTNEIEEIGTYLYTEVFEK